MLDIDITLVFQVIGFLVLLPILNRFLYKPAIKVLQERDDKIGGNLRRAAEHDREIADGLAAYEKRLKEAAVKGTEERAKARLEALAVEKRIIEAAREASAREIAAMKAELERNRHGALDALKAEARSIGSQMAEKLIDRKVVGVIVLFAMLLLPVIGFAAEADGHDEGDGGMLWKVINFVILVIGIGVVWKFVLKGILDKRGADIEKALKDAADAKANADRKYAEYQSKLAAFEAHVASVQNEIRLEGEAESMRMLAEAEAGAVKIREQAKVVAAQEVKKAKMELRREAASLAASMAEEMLRRDLKPDDQERLVKGYIEKLRLQ
ncbi:MAG: ATP synthase F0 subunit B [Deltaproteobacteria bacterium]|nr:ATP synthase F0 subunit B [Deltaproteobacteria bacterium]